MIGRLKANRPKRTAVQLIKDLETQKGVTFNGITRSEAVKFLHNNNNYFRLVSYKKNYTKNCSGKYLNMDFSHLIEISIIDMHLRNLIIKACIDIEHCLKVTILHDIENNASENGYDVVEEFLSDSKNAYVLSSIQRKSQSHYSGELISHYFNYQFSDGKYEFDCPIWAFLEMISFGTLVNFYTFYYNKYGNPPINPKILNSVKSLRNACAHNNCILHDLNQNPATVPLSEIIIYVQLNPNIGKSSIRKKLHNQFIMEFMALLYVMDKILSPKLKSSRKKDFKDFSKKRLVKNISYFNKNLLIKSSLEFVKKAIDFF